jgi:hypothetical protein
MSTNAPGSSLGTPVGDGLTWVNFFNGRLLTGDDLSAEQGSGSVARSQLGVTGGAGVVSGLSVQSGQNSSPTQPTVQVTPGLAVNGLGKPLQLAAAVELNLLAPSGSDTSSTAPDTATPSPGDFRTCAGAPPPPTYVTGSGVYVLVIGPAERGQGSATVNGQLTTPPAKTVGYTIDTVQFRLIAALDPSDTTLADPQFARNRVAYRFLGTIDSRRTAFEADPLAGASPAYSLIDDLVSAGAIAGSEVPLAAIFWVSSQGFQFIDLWSVRRRVARPSSETAWAPLVEDRARTEGEAMFLQFQAQVADAAFPGDATAAEVFKYLPPAGFVPLTTTSPAMTEPASPATGQSDSLIRSSPPVGSPPFGSPPETEVGFFAGLTVRGPCFINGAKVDELIRESFAYPPIDLSSGEVIWLYEIRENQEPGLAPADAPPVILFASGHLAYRANARFNLAYFNYSNYALRVEWRTDGLR